MKNFYFLLVVLFVFYAGNSQIINFPDPNFKARLLQAAPGLQLAYGANGSMRIDANNDGEIQVSEALAVTALYIFSGSITSIAGIENFSNLQEFNCYQNPITSMDLSPLTQLTRINIGYTQITSLNVTGLSHVEWLNCVYGQLTSLDLTGMTTMYQLQCYNNQLTSMSISNASNLLSINCRNNLLTNLDVSNVNPLYNLDCSSNNLTQLSLKNNFAEINLDFSNNPNLQYVCADEVQLEEIQNKILQYGYTNCFANTQCSFIPGNPVYIISGLSKYDELNDGCDIADSNYPELKFILSDGSTSGNVFSNIDGEFSTGTQSPTVTITPELEYPAYFSVTPSSQTLTLSGSSNPVIQNFCITPNGIHPDLEVSLQRTNGGFDAYRYYYILTYKNKGTHTQSGNISLAFDDNQQNFEFSTPSSSTSTTNLVTWNFSDLKPFETRTIQIQFIMNLGSGVNDGDILNYTANISGSVDETPTDNTYVLNEFYSTVVLSNSTFSDYFGLYPNPTQEILHIKAKNDVAIENIAIYNLLGQSVINTKVILDDTEIDVSGLTSGTYIIKIFSDKGIYNSKFLKN